MHYTMVYKQQLLGMRLFFIQATIVRDEIIFLSDALYYDLSNNVKAGGKICIFLYFFLSLV